jgi:hypothetical protein
MASASPTVVWRTPGGSCSCQAGQGQRGGLHLAQRLADSSISKLTLRARS